LFSRFTLIQQLAVFSGLLFSVKGSCASLNGMVAGHAIDTHMMRRLYTVNWKGIPYFERQEASAVKFDDAFGFYKKLNE